MLILCYILVGLGIGVISGTLGIGGGVLLVPVLIRFFDYGQTQAQGITLAVLVVPVVLPAVWQYYELGLIDGEDLGTAAWIALGFTVGGFVGAAYIVKHLHNHVDTLRMLFGFVLIYIAVRFLLRSDQEVAKTVVGLAAVTLAWLGLLGLRMLGRKHLTKPNLGEKIRGVSPPDTMGSEYYI